MRNKKPLLSHVILLMHGSWKYTCYLIKIDCIWWLKQLPDQSYYSVIICITKQSCNKDSTKIILKVVVKNLYNAGNLYQWSTTLCQINLLFTPKVGTKSWIQCQQSSPSIKDPCRNSSTRVALSFISLQMTKRFSQKIHFIFPCKIVWLTKKYNLL